MACGDKPDLTCWWLHLATVNPRAGIQPVFKKGKTHGLDQNVPKVKIAIVNPRDSNQLVQVFTSAKNHEDTWFEPKPKVL